MSLRSLFQSILALLCGLIAGIALSIGTDAVLEATHVVPSLAYQQVNGSPTWFLVLAILYRTLYTGLSGYIGARLAPRRPMLHAMILGTIAFLANLGGTFAMWQLGQHWYPIALTVLSLPSSWLGGYLWTKMNHSNVIKYV